MGEVRGEKAFLSYFFARRFQAMPQLTERLEQANLFLIMEQRIKALTTHFYRVSLDLKKIFINTSGKVTQI